jgi:hypothetical protein
MANLSGANPNLNTPEQGPRRHDPIDDLLTIGTFSNESATDNGTGVSFNAEKVGGYLAVLTHNYAGAASDSNNWTISIQGADNSSYTNAVTLASIRVTSGSAPQKEYLALEGAAARSLRDAAGEDELVYVRAVATKTGTTANFTGKVYLTCE